MKILRKGVLDLGYLPIELYRQDVKYHTFKTSYFEVSFRLTFFSPTDNRPRNGAFEIN